MLLGVPYVFLLFSENEQYVWNLTWMEPDWLKWTTIFRIQYFIALKQSKTGLLLYFTLLKHNIGGAIMKRTM